MISLKDLTKEEAKSITDLYSECKPDAVNHPPHYNKGKYEVIDIIENYVKDAPDGFYGYCFGNSIKYLLRHLYKGSNVDDLKKCCWYIDKMIAGENK